ncbi:MAG: acylphosphatase [bacterium]
MLSEVKQATIIIEGDVQLLGFRSYVDELASRHDLAGFVYTDISEGNVKFVCEGEVPKIEEVMGEINKFLGVSKVSIQDRVILPKPVGRVVIGVERDIFDRLDLGVTRLGSIDGHLASIGEHTASIDTRLEENTGILGDIRNILEKIAEK